MIRSPARSRAGGWSLVELAVVLAVIGVLGLALWRVLPLAPQVAQGDAARRELARAEQALIGYALSRSRLPAPVTIDGLDMLPVEALGLPSTMRLRYQVQTSLTVAPGNSFMLQLPSGITGATNGLDFCMSLKQVLTPLAGMDGVPTAFALMHPGPPGHDGNAAAGFALPGSAGIGSRQVLAIGPGELASRLACPDRVARTLGAGRAALAAHDLELVAERYQAFREFAIQVAEMNRDNAEAGVAFASFDVAWGVFIEAIAILQEIAGWPPDPVGIATGITAHASATAQLAIAIANVVLAAEDLAEANDALEQSRDQKAAADRNLARMQSLADDALMRAQHLDQQGLQP